MLDLTGKIGKYRILKKIGSGGFGTVYLVEDTILKVKRAVKVPHKLGKTMDKILQESIVQTKLLDHPNIVKLLTVDIIDNNILMVMEYIDGTDLETIIDEKNNLDLKEALHYFRQILSALNYAHKNKIIHRDIRPSNILIDKNNNVKITDFGTSRLLEDKQYATTRIGSPPYMAPEQFEGKAVFASDIYSAGCLMYEMLTGFPPIIYANPMDIYRAAREGKFTPLKSKRPDIPSKLNNIITKCISGNLNSRYDTVVEVINDLNQFENKSQDFEQELERIKTRIIAKQKTKEYKTCWKCKKTILKKLEVCPYCGAEQ